MAITTVKANRPSAAKAVTAKPAADDASRVEAHDRGFHRRYPPGSPVELHFRLTRRLVGVARLWGTRIDEQLRLRGQVRSTWEALLFSSLRSDQGGRTQTSLARSVHTEGPNLARALDRLENDGLIERTACSADRRAKRIVVTPAGEHLIDEVSRTIDGMRAELLTGISEREIEQVIAVVTKIYARLDPGEASIDLDAKV